MVVALHAACMATCAHVTTCLLMHALVDAANCRQSELSDTRPPLQQLGHIYCSCHGGYAVQLWARCNSTGTDSSAAYMGPLVALTQARQVLDRPATTITRVLKGLGIRLHTEVSVARREVSACTCLATEVSQLAVSTCHHQGTAKSSPQCNGASQFMCPQLPCTCPVQRASRARVMPCPVPF